MLLFFFDTNCWAAVTRDKDTILESVDLKIPSYLNSAPGSDTGQSAMPVRVISQLGAVGGAGGGGDASAANQTTEIAKLTSILADTDKIPSSPAQEHATAGSPNSCRLSDGAAFISTLPVSIASMPSTPVTGTFWQATQPVSGTFWQSTQPVSIASMPSTPVTGTFWQATQPISASSLPLPSGASTDVAQGATTSGETGALVQGATTTSAPTYTTAKTNPLSLNTSGGLRVDGSGVTQPVSGTFWQATQPVSGTFFQATQPVSGTFWQATQPVSIASMPSTPVTGTFWQATQPVSGTFWQATQPVSGTVAATESGTWTMQPGNTANTTAWLMTINDGTNSAKVEAASTAAAAADKSLVVSQNPTGGNPCLNPTATLTSITGATSGTSAVQIIALSGSTKIYICSMTIIGVSGTSPTFSLVQGTGSNCVTSQTKVVQAWTTGAGTLYAFANPVAVGVAGNELCYLDTGTTPVQNYQINYVQQ